jgi:NitT/TauT family transport system substrate-binding protein
VRILLPSYTGTSDLYWYVKADSPIKSLKDATDKNTIAYSTNGSSSNNIVIGFVEELGLKAKPTATGGLPGTLTSVMSGQIDIGWGAPPFGVKELNEGKIRIIARGSDIPSLRGQTVRAIIVNADALAKKKDTMMRFSKAFREAVNWMYDDPAAVAMYAKKINTDEAIVKQSIKEYQTRDALQTDEMKDMDGAMKDAVKLKFLDKVLTPEQVKEFVQISSK